MKRHTMIVCTAAVAAFGVAAGGMSPVGAVECSRYEVSTDPGRVTAVEFDQLRDGMTLEQVQALFGSAGTIEYAGEYSSSKTMRVQWLGSVSLVEWIGWTTTPEIEATFSMEKATTETTYKRKKVKVKNVKRAKRLGLRTWRWKTVKVVKQIPATPYTVDYFSLSDAEVLRQTGALSCSTY